MQCKASIVTLGCRVNQYESQACGEIIASYGYDIVPLQKGCQLYFVNTCSVTAESDRKCRQSIHKVLEMAKEEDATVILCGCHIQAHPQSFYEGAKVFRCGNGDKSEFVRKVMEGAAPKDEIPLREEMKPFYPTRVCRSKNTRAFLKIEDGCDNFCSYCIVPHLRGPVRSRPVDEILQEAGRLADNGYQELVLSGIETSFYGKDLEAPTDLCTLAQEVGKLEKVKRIRFGSLRPTVFTEEFTRRLSENEKILPHFHLSIQSGSDKILAMMRRNYSRQDIFQVFDRVRRYFPQVTFSADLICGFPGETEQDYADSVETVNKGRFLHAHIFPYSERPGTPAAQMQCQVPVHLRKERCARLLSHSEKIARDTILDHRGNTFEMLVEKTFGNAAFGYTENFIYTQVHAPQAQIGKILKVVLTGEVERKSASTVAKAKLLEESE